jgi:AcrR family transcriptional regulator
MPAECQDVTVTYHHGDLPAALLEAVEAAVAEHGVSAVSLRDVARRAGVSHSAPAHHFGSKAGLLTAFATAGYWLLAETARAEVAALGAAGTAADAAAEVAAMGRGYFRFAVGHPAQFEVMFRLDALNPADRDLAAARDAVYSLLTAAVGRCHAAGRLHGRSPEVVTAAAWSLAHGLSALWISGHLAQRTGEQDPQKLAKTVLDMFVQAVLPPQPVPGEDR